MDFSRPLLMSIVNCTSDSFYGGSRNPRAEDAAAAAFRAEEDGADIIDFGAESTRPGSEYISTETELSRLIPPLRAFRKKSALPVSVDTRKAETARAALDEGADIINDISAFGDEAMAALCAEKRAAVVLVHMRGNPKTMQQLAFAKAAETETEGGICMEVREFLRQAADRALAAGMRRENIILDPGIGFGKTVKENLCILARLEKTMPREYPFLIGLSRKNFIGEITGREVYARLAGTLAAACAALEGGADILRLHDTAAARDVIKVFQAVADARREQEVKE